MMSRLLLKKQGWDWAQPSANYEMAVVTWADVRKQENEDDKRKKAEECYAWLDKVAKWGPFLLDARVGMRVQTGMDTLRWYKREHGWGEL